MAEEEKDAISIELGAERVRAAVSQGALSSLGSAIDWLMPRRAAKVRITGALAESVANKIEGGAPLSEAERLFVGMVFEREARRLSNQQEVVDTIHKVFPEVQEQLRALPEYERKGTTRTFVERAESIASEITDEHIREVFARVLAGEISRPGGYSLRTLEAVRTLDPEIAELFDGFRGFVAAGEWVFYDRPLLDHLAESGFRNSEILELQDAGLIDNPMSIMISVGPAPGNSISDWRYGDRTIRIRSLSLPAPRRSFSTSMLRLTRVGRELASVLRPRVHDAYFMAVGSWLARHAYDSGSVEWKLNGEDEWRSFPK